MNNRSLKNNEDNKLLPLGKMRDGLFLGNDIIDWQNAQLQKNKLRQRCLEKLFVDKEVYYILNHEYSILAFWQLWSAKEATYKAWQRLNNHPPVYNPKSFICYKIETDSLNVVNSEFNCRIETNYTPGYIYSQAANIQLVHKIFESNKSYFAFIKKMKEKNWTLKKTIHNIPFFYNENSGYKKPLTISHDKKFTAIAWSR